VENTLDVPLDPLDPGDPYPPAPPEPTVIAYIPGEEVTGKDGA
jgi:hypothetical protein